MSYLIKWSALGGLRFRPMVNDQNKHIFRKSYDQNKHIFRKSLFFNWKGQRASFNCDSSNLNKVKLAHSSSRTSPTVTVRIENYLSLPSHHGYQFWPGPELPFTCYQECKKPQASYYASGGCPQSPRRIGKFLSFRLLHLLFKFSLVFFRPIVPYFCFSWIQDL